ncbi:MAG: tetratricopeptide repeat protein [Simkaniaceae bacterium]
MSEKNWMELLGWSEDQLEDIRFVGYTYIKEGQYDTALSFFQALTALNPNNLYDMQTLGALYLQKGESQEALNYLERALKIDESHLPTKLNQVKALFLLGFFQQALPKAQELAAASDPDIANKAQALIQAYS